LFAYKIYFSGEKKREIKRKREIMRRENER
jgi:hypothetical protein